MPQTGYGGSVVGVALGTFPSIESVNVEGITGQEKVVRCITDASRIGTRMPTVVDEGNVTVRQVLDSTTKTLYGTLRTYALARTQDTFTITDGEGDTHVGLGRILSCGKVPIETETEEIFETVISPVTQWTYTAAA